MGLGYPYPGFRSPNKELAMAEDEARARKLRDLYSRLAQLRAGRDSAADSGDQGRQEWYATQVKSIEKRINTLKGTTSYAMNE